MRIRKDLVIVALATFCLTATLFMVVPTRSEWDPWADLKEDGTVDIYDAIKLADAFGTSGDTTKNVNVTNPRAKVVEADLNISIATTGSSYPAGWGQSSTDAFTTDGYDRMFVSAAIVDISNHNQGSTSVYLEGVSWIWATINGKKMTTLAPSDQNRQLRIYLWNASDLPISNSTAEFTVEAAQGSLPFVAYTWFTSGWILLRVSVYLTSGTTSPPSVQNTYVTNWPYSQPQPSYGTQYLYFNTSITNGIVFTDRGLFVSGYSRIFLSIEIINASYSGVPVKTTISLSDVGWNGYAGWETVPTGVLNATYYGTSLPVYSQQIPPEFKTRCAQCILNFRVSSEAFSGWVEWYATVYLRNE